MSMKSNIKEKYLAYCLCVSCYVVLRELCWVLLPRVANDVCCVLHISASEHKRFLSCRHFMLLLLLLLSRCLRCDLASFS